MKPLRLPARSPNLNAFAERFVLSITSECLERMVLLGEAHVRTAALQYLEHDHRGLRTEWLVAHEKILPNGPVKRRQRLGGLLNFYDREAV